MFGFRDYHEDYVHLLDFIGRGDSEEHLTICCHQLDLYWRTHCECTKTIFGLLHYTTHNQDAKNRWGEMDGVVWRLRRKMNEA